MSSVLYTRLSGELKQALTARARRRGQSLNAAACELIAAGLAAGEEEQAGDGLRRELAARASELAQAKERLAEAELRLQAAREREELSARTHPPGARRARAGRARRLSPVSHAPARLRPPCQRPLPELREGDHRPPPPASPKRGS